MKSNADGSSAQVLEWIVIAGCFGLAGLLAYKLASVYLRFCHKGKEKL